MLTLCTIVTRQDLPRARILAASFLDHHRGGTALVLVLDGPDQPSETMRGRLRTLRLSDLDLDSRELGRMVGSYDAAEMAAALKPRFLQHVLQGHESALYLTADAKVYAPLDDVDRLTTRHDIVLAPRTTVPLPDDDRNAAPSQLLRAGPYCDGFCAVGQRSGEVLAWWAEQSRADPGGGGACPPDALRRLVDLIPVFFDAGITTDAGCSASFWNLHGRELTWTGSRYEVDGAPLRWFVFDGFDPSRPHLLSDHQGERPRLLLSERPALRRLCGEYRADLIDAGAAAPETRGGWGHLPSGLELTPRIRRIFRDGLASAKGDPAREPPSPIDADHPERFVDWLNEPVAAAPYPVVSRYLYAMYLDRPDLRTAFPHLGGPDAARFLEWTRGDGVVQEHIPPQLLPGRAEIERAGRPRFKASQLQEGVNIVGYFKAEMGVGEHARLLASAIAAAGIEHSTLTVTQTLSRQAHPYVDRGDPNAPFDINLLSVNADQTPIIGAGLGPSFFNGRYTVGFWAWELEQLPEWMLPAFEWVDEVWCASRFVAAAVTAASRRPVQTIPYPFVLPEYPLDWTRATLGLPSGFLFLFMFDFLSILERKNPFAVVDAFERAFGGDHGKVLVLKSMNGSVRGTDLERLRLRIADLPNVVLIDGYFSVAQKNAALALCDCYVSLHRSEGTGITMAEAMALGKPVIATGYSGNLDFMSERNAYLVDYTLGSVPAGCDPYPRGSRWADPDVDHAAERLREVVEQPAEAARRGSQGRADILTRHSPQVCGQRIAQRLSAIRTLKTFRQSRTRVRPVTA